ncbi:MAG: hypothetical protein O7J95_12635 [Planctomycetota bacterium]|nr:hypothetical protein [Planctomycetota bacterium]
MRANRAWISRAGLVSVLSSALHATSCHSGHACVCFSSTIQHHSDAHGCSCAHPDHGHHHKAGSEDGERQGSQSGLLRGEEIGFSSGFEAGRDDRLHGRGEYARPPVCCPQVDLESLAGTHVPPDLLDRDPHHVDAFLTAFHPAFAEGFARGFRDEHPAGYLAGYVEADN